MLEKLMNMIKESEGIELFVIEDILDNGDNDEEIKGYIENVLNYGCVSGTVSSLTYYRDTKKFFKEYFEEILELAEQVKEEYGLDNIELNFNSLAWLAYEETLKNIASELEIF